MQRYNISNATAAFNNHTSYLDLDTPVVSSIEEDLLAQYFWSNDQSSSSYLNGLGIVDGDNSNCDQLSLLMSRGTTTQSSGSCDSESQDDQSEMDKSHKLTEATKDTANYKTSFDFAEETKQTVVEKEIFLISKLKKREPRRSFDLGTLRHNQDVIFDSNDQPCIYIPARPSLCVDKEKLATIYNQMVDEGFCPADTASKLCTTEHQILEALLKLRFTLTKTIQDDQFSHLLSHINKLNSLLSQSSYLKKRSEELLKKNFKTVLKIMLDKERKNQPKGTSATQARKLFTDKFFGCKARDYDKIFKCIQMSQEYYCKVFEFTAFKKAFSCAHQEFMVQFIADRIKKTDNLISQIKTDLLSGKDIKPNLRTPWSVKEAEASMKLMSQFL
jgi:hypothetical protein